MAAPKDAMPVVRVQRTDGRVSVSFPILRQKVVRAPDNSEGLVLEFGGDLEGRYVGMQAIIGLQWDEEKQPGLAPSFWWGDMQMMSAGPQSDLLLRGLALLYDMQPPPVPSRQSIALKVAAIGLKPTALSDELPLKVFMQEAGKPDYAEFYLGINLAGKTVDLVEKDPSYRAAMLRNFFAEE